MKRRENEIDEIVDRHLGLCNSPPSDEMEHAEERILRRLRSESVGTPKELSAESHSVRTRWTWRRFAVLAAAAVLVLVVFGLTSTMRNFAREIDAHAVVESADG